ncbi:MAG: DUF2867 domain-containing protein [Thalassobaculaceae bacterium]|nr:DUF2867 domain-containing protein [Thalassobaculaceae bacterium]
MASERAAVQTQLPADSRLHDRVGPDDFLDCYSVRADFEPRPAAEIIVQFPGWARALLKVRRALTAPFGLSNDGPEAADKLGIFPVEQETEREIIAGFNDRHLNFRISVYAESGRVYLATWVHPHNLGGRLYLAAILPFHIAIARNALNRVAALYCARAA